jgi:hypothetical protein
MRRISSSYANRMAHESTLPVVLTNLFCLWACALGQQDVWLQLLIGQRASLYDGQFIVELHACHTLQWSFMVHSGHQQPGRGTATYQGHLVGPALLCGGECFSACVSLTMSPICMRLFCNACYRSLHLGVATHFTSVKTWDVPLRQLSTQRLRMTRCSEDTG